MVLLPYRLETTFTRYPIANWTIIGSAVLLFIAPLFDVVSYDSLEGLVLRDWDISQMLGSLFLHGDIFHLLGNMLFLWVFGNAVNAAVGNISYPFLFLFLGICASVTHLSFDAHAAIGASGAISGVVGMVLVLFPYNRTTNFYWFALPMFLGMRGGRVELKAFWIILYFNVFDFLAVMIGSDDGIGHWAHIGGFVFGIIYGLIAAQLKLVETYSPSLIDVFAGRAKQPDVKSTDEIQTGLSTQFEMNALAAPALQVESPRPQPLAVARSAPPPTPAKLDPDLHLRVCVGGGSSVTLHIVNNGGPMKEIVLRVPKGVVAEVSPRTAILSGQTGWIKFVSTDSVTIDSIEFIVVYKNKFGAPGKKRYRCVPAENSLAEVRQS